MRRTFKTLRLGAAALTLALVAAAPAEAKLYTVTMTAGQAGASPITGSMLLDTATEDAYGDSTFTVHHFWLTNPTGFFRTTLQDTSSGRTGELGIGHYNSGGNATLWMFNNAYAQDGMISYSEQRNIYGQMGDIGNLFTPAAIASGRFDEFLPGEHAMSDFSGGMYTDSYDMINFENSSSVDLNATSVSLRFSPVAPAPLAGGGLLSALAALLGLSATRLIRRRSALA